MSKEEKVSDRFRKLLDGRKPYTWEAQVGFTRGTLPRVFNEHKIPGWELLRGVVHVENVNLHWLLEGDGPPFRVLRCTTDAQAEQELGRILDAQIIGTQQVAVYLAHHQGTLAVVVTWPQRLHTKRNDLEYVAVKILAGLLGPVTLGGLRQRLGRFRLFDLPLEWPDMERLGAGAMGNRELLGLDKEPGAAVIHRGMPLDAPADFDALLARLNLAPNPERIAVARTVGKPGTGSIHENPTARPVLLKTLGTDPNVYVSIPMASEVLEGGHLALRNQSPVAFRQEDLCRITGSGAVDLVVMPVATDRMEPVLKKGDMVLVDRQNAFLGPKEGAIFVLNLDGQLVFRRFSMRDKGEVRVYCQTPRERDGFVIHRERLDIIGQVIWAAVPLQPGAIPC
ncbi:MAG: S24 family peptidase [Magnetococcales bacterium]|nr:S24 family peptidase [Magnetococcales bacterium]